MIPRFTLYRQGTFVERGEREADGHALQIVWFGLVIEIVIARCRP